MSEETGCRCKHYCHSENCQNPVKDEGLCEVCLEHCEQEEEDNLKDDEEGDEE